MAKDIPAEIATLKTKLAKLEAQRLEELREKRKVAQQVVVDLDAQIAAITGKAAAPAGRRKRTSPAEVRARIVDALTKDPKGLTQKQIADQTSLPYGSVVLFLRRNAKDFKTTGERKSKRYFLK
jgi:hypothetical protein